MICKNNDHELIEISNNYHNAFDEEVVRWCKKCGAIVVDLDYDNRIYPGFYMKMKFPKG